MNSRRLVTGYGWVDFSGPGIDAAAEGLGVFESLIAEPGGDVEGTLSVVAENDEMLVRIEFLMGARGHVAHGHEQAAVDAGCFKFPWFADIDEASLVFAEERCRIGCRYFVVEHGYSLERAGDDLPLFGVAWDRDLGPFLENALEGEFSDLTDSSGLRGRVALCGQHR